MKSRMITSHGVNLTVAITLDDKKTPWHWVVAMPRYVVVSADTSSVEEMIAIATKFLTNQGNEVSVAETTQAIRQLAPS